MYLEKKVSGPVFSTNLHKIMQIRSLTDRAFILRFDRGNMQFKSGQHIIVDLKGDLNQREYSVYSGEQDECVLSISYNPVQPKLEFLLNHLVCLT